MSAARGKTTYQNSKENVVKPSRTIYKSSGPVAGKQSYRRIDFTEVKELAHGRMDEILDALDADYKEEGNELVIINPHRRDNDYGSFKFNTLHGLWSEFADGEAGNDSISFVAYYLGVEQHEAAIRILEILEPDGPPTPVAVQEGREAANDPSPRSARLREVKASTQVSPVPADAPCMPTTFSDLGVPTDTYIYRNAEGIMTGAILRFEDADGNKDIRPMTLHAIDGDLRWQMKSWNTPRPLYNLDQLAQNPEMPVMLGEGEKAANALAILFPNHVATTTMGGSNGARKADLTPLYGRTVYIWPDNDDAGTKYASDVIETLRQHDEKAPIFVLKKLVVEAGVHNVGPFLIPGFDAPKGHDAADALAEHWTEGHAQLLLDEGHFEPVPMTDGVQGVEDAPETRCIWTPTGTFVLTADGIYQIKVLKDEEKHVWLASKIIVRSNARDGDDCAWGVLVDFCRPDGTMGSEYLSLADLQGSAERALARLADLGVKISSQTASRAALADYLKSQPLDPQFHRLTVKTGWAEDCAFVTPQAVLGYPKQAWLYTGATTGRNIYESRGTLEDWKAHVARLCIGNSRLALAVCVALAGPLQHVMGAENGGIHLRGNSSIGKSASLYGALSVWSPPGALLSWRTTDNALEASALARNDTLLTLDEMSQAATNVVGAVAYMIGNGQGKGRAQANMKARAIERFRCQVVSTGEVSLESHMATGGHRIMAGQDVRFLDIPADAGVGLGLFENLHGEAQASLFAENLRAASGMFYGTAGTGMVERLCHDLSQDREALMALLERHRSLFMEANVPAGSNGQIRRVAARFALYAAAGEYAIATGLLPWAEGEAMGAAATCFRAWLAERGGVDSLEKMRALRQVKGFLERWGTSRFAPWEPLCLNNEVVRTVDQCGFYRKEEGGVSFYVFPEVFNNAVCEGFDSKQVRKWLVEDGWLETDKGGKTPTTANLPGIGCKRVYKLLPIVMADGEPEPAAPVEPPPASDLASRYDL